MTPLAEGAAALVLGAESPSAGASGTGRDWFFPTAPPSWDAGKASGVGARSQRGEERGGGPAREHPILGGPVLIVLGRGPRRILFHYKLIPSWQRNRVRKDF